MGDLESARTELCLVVYFVEWDSNPVYDSIWEDWRLAVARVDELETKAGIASATYELVGFNAPGEEEILNNE